MKKLLLSLLFCLITSIAFAETYYLMNDGYIKRKSDLAMIPPTTENKDYVEYLEDIGKGVEVKPYDYAAENQRQVTEQAKIKIEKDREKLIQDKIREQAITELKKEGKIVD